MAAAQEQVSWLMGATWPTNMDSKLMLAACPRVLLPAAREVAQVAQIFGGVNTLSGSVRTESVSAEFSTAASEPWLRLHVTVEE